MINVGLNLIAPLLLVLVTTSVSQVIDNNIVFSATRSSVLAGAHNPVPFETILIDTVNNTDRGGFDDSKSYYTIPVPGFYLIHMSVGVPAFTPLTLTLNNASRVPNLLLTHTLFDGELTTSRDDIQWYEAGQRIYLSTANSLYSDSLLQVTWSGFRLGFVSSPQIAFSVARKTNFGEKGSRIIFDHVFISLSGAWDPCNSQFRAPELGIYFLSWSSASVPNEIHTMSLYINGQYRTRSHIHGDYFDGVDTSSQSIVISLNSGDTAYMELADGIPMGPLYSDDNYQTAFMGFLYSPTHGQKVSWTLSTWDTYVGPIDQVVFNNIIHEEGFTWDSSTSQVVIPVSGLYYVKLAGNALEGNYKFNIILMLDGQPLMNAMEKVSVLGEHENLRNRALIYRFNRDAILTVSLPAGYQIYGEYTDTIFSGFLLTPSN